MTTATITALIIGGALCLLALLAIAKPGLFKQGVEGLPRNKPVSWALTAVCLFWAAWVLYHATFWGRFIVLRPAIFLAAPVAFVLIVWLLDELLAARALGGFLMLIANPILNIVRWLDTPWRLVLVVLAYALAILGMIFMMNPYRLRHIMARMIVTPERCRMIAGIGLCLGLVIVGLGLFVY